MISSANLKIFGGDCQKIRVNIGIVSIKWVFRIPNLDVNLVLVMNMVMMMMNVDQDDEHDYDQ